MNVEGEKIKTLIEHYGESKGYAKKSYTKLFCDDHGLNYIQWTAYVKDTQKLGIKIVYELMNIFPDLNMNWLLKDDLNVFILDNQPQILAEPSPKYGKSITNLDLFKKMEELEKEVKKLPELLNTLNKENQ